MSVQQKCNSDKHAKFEAPKSTLLFCCNPQGAQSSCAIFLKTARAGTVDFYSFLATVFTKRGFLSNKFKDNLMFFNLGSKNTEFQQALDLFNSHTILLSNPSLSFVQT